MKSIAVIVGISLVSAAFLIARPGSAAAPSQAAVSDAACVDARIKMIADARTFATSLRAGCVQDTDCVMIDPSIACQESCPVAVLASKAQAMRSSVAQFESDKCGAADRQALAGCGASPSCAVGMSDKAVCRNGACAEDYQAGPSGSPPGGSAANASQDAG